jgi:nucleotide-binding universal stress UspA family protein
MVHEGIPENRIETVTQSAQVGVAKDILNRAEQGLYDAVVLARRGLTPSRDFFIGSIASKVVEHALEIPVWVAAEETVSMKMMLAVDGSENSLRVVDYLINMVGANPDLRLTLFHVVPCLRHYYSVDFEKEHLHLQEILQRGDQPRMEGFYEKANTRFEAAGLKKSQIEIKTSTQSYDISTGILGEVKRGQYGTVVIGRRGEREAFFTGRIAMRLVQKVSDQVLWVVP